MRKKITKNFFDYKKYLPADILDEAEKQKNFFLTNLNITRKKILKNILSKETT